MNNFEVKEQLKTLQDEFIRVLNDTNNVFELNPRIKELKKEIDNCGCGTHEVA